MRRTPLSLTLFLFVPLLLGSAARGPVRPGVSAPIPSFSDRVALQYEQAAAALRRKDCAGAAKALTPVMLTRGADAVFAQLLSGLYARTCGQVATAEERLFAAADPDGALEDWRLYLLSEAAVTRGHLLLAQASLAKLIGDYPASPLRPRALLEAAELAWQRGNAARALELVDIRRREEIAGESAVGLEKLAWQIGLRQGDPEIQRAAARRLLCEAPTAAAELQVIEVFRRPDGGISWSAFLSAEQLQRRARALLDMKLAPSSLAVLDAVAPAERNLDWLLLKAKTLTSLHRGQEALALLASGPAAATPAQVAALEWERAEAAADIATAQRGRNNLPSAERQWFRRAAQQHLQKVVQSGDTELAVKALRALYADAVEEDRFERSIEILRQLRQLDPADTTGAANLWQRGWRDYNQRNYTGAVGYWTELFDLYPDDANGRRGRYWTARAFEALGETERAHQIYAEVAGADTTDFYRKNALARLRRQPAPPSEREPEPWPADPTLERARLLTDLGLDELALSEAALVAEAAQPRAMRALEALVLARQGQRRKSVQVIRDAFPALGGAFQANLPEQARRLYYPLDYQEPIRTWAGRNHLPSHLVFGIVRQESAFDADAQSWAGARGLMQLMPATARELAGKFGLPYSHDRLADPAFNVRLGTAYFRQVLGMFDGNLELALAGYNGGPYRIKRLWTESGARELDRFLESLGLEESKTYVKRILVLSDSYRQLYPHIG